MSAEGEEPAPPRVPNAVLGVGVTLARKRAVQLEAVNKSLVDTAKGLKAEVEDLQESQVDVYAFLSKKVEAGQDEISKYQAHVAALTDEIARVHELREAGIRSAVQEREGVISTLRKDLKLVQEELERVEDFKLQRESLLAELADHKDTIQRQQEEHKVALQDEERKNLAERQHIKNTMYNRMLATKEEIIREMVNGVDDTVRRTMAENEHMTTELAYQSKRAEEVMDANKALREDCSRLRGENGMMEQQVEELVRRTHLLQRVVHQGREDGHVAERRVDVLTKTLEGMLEPKVFAKFSKEHLGGGALAASGGDMLHGDAAAPREGWQHVTTYGSAPTPTSVQSKDTESSTAALRLLGTDGAREVPSALRVANAALKKRLATAESGLAGARSQLAAMEAQRAAQTALQDSTTTFLLAAAEDVAGEMRQLHALAPGATADARAADATLRHQAITRLLRKMQVHEERQAHRGTAASTPVASKGRIRSSPAEVLPPLTHSITTHSAGLLASLSSASFSGVPVSPLTRKR